MPKNIDQSKLQTAVGTMMANDAGLTSLLGDRVGRIQGATSSDTAFPYVSLGDDFVIDASVQGLAARTVRMKIHVWTQELGFTLNKKIESHIVALFDDEPISVIGHRVVSCFHYRSQFSRGLMQGVRHGEIEFEVELE